MFDIIIFSKGFDKMQKITIFTDGSAHGKGENRNGGCAAIVWYHDEKDCKSDKYEEFGLHADCTTNNRMELMAVIIGLESIKEPSKITIYSDSSYVVNAYQKKWMTTWLNNGWKTSTNQSVKNQDLWERLNNALKNHNITFVWVKGHNGHPENERCDWLANMFADNKPLVRKDGKYYSVIKKLSS